jgi:excisionase family DNA binding protein
MSGRTGSVDDAALRTLIQEIQSELDRAEMSYRAAMAAHRRAGDKLVDLSYALRRQTEGVAIKNRPLISFHDVSAPAKTDRNPEPQIDPLLVSIREAIRISGVGRTRLYELLNAGELSARKIGSRTLILYASLKGWIEALPAKDSR